MESALISPASATILGIPAQIIYILIPLMGVGIFAYIIRRRVAPLLKAVWDSWTVLCCRGSGELSVIFITS
jgi:hypothetical protein